MMLAAVTAQPAEVVSELFRLTEVAPAFVAASPSTHPSSEEFQRSVQVLSVVMKLVPQATARLLNTISPVADVTVTEGDVLVPCAVAVFERGVL